MIALLRGEVTQRRSDSVVLLCGGVGYRVTVSGETLRHLPPAGETATLHTHLIAREDALSLYGFHTERERELFLQLLAVQAVGPKVAIAVLSGGSAAELCAAIAAGDARRFQSVPGIGKRTAERIIVELREKVSLDADTAAGDQITVRARARGANGSQREIAREGLLELGYAALEAEQLLGGAQGDSAEALIADALRTARTGA
jgi:holliday junction DNA helicase RuvA